MTINKPPEEVLLVIFEFYMAYPLPLPFHEEDGWHTLVHVCQQWRCVVFGSPRRLNLRLLCTNRRLEKALGIWPELPIAMHVNDQESCPYPSVTNVISVLKQNNRVCKISISSVSNSFLEAATKITEPFPALIELELASFKVDPPTFPDSFLGGSTPHLRSLYLWGIPFPGIGRLLLSTRDLVALSLGFIPNSGYISPEAMVDHLSALTRLKTLHLSFEIPRFWNLEPNRRPSALTPIILPALTTFDFAGDSKYLGDMVSRIDAPLDCVAFTVTLCDQRQLAFDFSLLSDFISRTKLLNSPHRADISFTDYDSRISLFQRKGGVDFKVLNLSIPCFVSDSQLSVLAQASSPLLLPLPSLEHLNIYKSASEPWSLRILNGVVNAQWIELLRPFIAVKDLVLDEQVVLSVASALQDLVGEHLEILPSLQIISLEGFLPSGPVPEGIVKFVAARELCGHPVAVHHRARK